jgi:thioredoxin 1
MEINDLYSLEAFIAENPAVLIYFFNDNCAPCMVLRPKVIALLESQFPLVELAFINASQNSGLTSAFGIYSAPTVIVFFDGKEVIRESKYLSINELKDKIARYYSLFFN